MRRHADLLLAGRHFDQVEIAVLNGSPSIAEALARIAAPVIRVVPFFMEQGYFTRVALPRALREAGGHLASPRLLKPAVEALTASSFPNDRAPPHGAADTNAAHPQAMRQRLVLCRPVGVHDGIAGVIERQALAACADLGIKSRSAAVVVIGHGSARSPGRTLALHMHAARVASTAMFARVEAACLEEPPFVAETLASLRHHPVVVIGFFANEGGHVRDDVPSLIDMEVAARGASGLAVRFQGSVTSDEAMVEIILDQSRL